MIFCFKYMKWNRYQRGLVSMVHKFFDKSSDGAVTCDWSEALTTFVGFLATLLGLCIGS